MCVCASPGLYGYNGCLTGMGMAAFTFVDTYQLIGPIVLMSAFSSVLVVALGKTIVARLGLSPFTFAFQLCTFIWLLGALRYRYYSLDGALVAPSLAHTLTDAVPTDELTVPHYTAALMFKGFSAGVAQVFFISSPYTGVVVVAGVFVCSPILALFAAIGSISGALVAAVALGVDPATIELGLWGFNTTLTCQAMGGMFFVLISYKIWLFTLFASTITILVQGAIGSLLGPVGMPTLTLPFTLVCWVFCLMAGSSSDLIAVKLVAVSIPEDHRRRYRLTRLVKSHFSFLTNLRTVLHRSAPDEDISNEELQQIEQDFVPVLMCTFAQRNDSRSLQGLLREGANVDAPEYDGRTALHLAACMGHLEVVRFLVEEAAAPTHVLDKFARTPLDDAVFHAQTAVAEYLQAHWKGPNTKKRGSKAISGLLYRELSLSCASPSLSVVTDGQVASSAGSVPPTNASHASRGIEVELEPMGPDAPTVRIHHDQPTPLPTGVPAPSGGSASLPAYAPASLDEDSVSVALLPSLFCAAANRGDVTQMATLVREFPSFRFDCVDYDYRSAAHISAAAGQTGAMQWLVARSQEAAPNASHPGDPLHWMRRPDRWGVTPLEEACVQGHTELLEYLGPLLSARGTEPTRDSTDAAAGPPGVSSVSSPPAFQRQASTLTNVGASRAHADVASSVRRWRKTLHFCHLACAGDTGVIERLLRYGVFSVSDSYADYDGRTPMHLAAVYGHIDLVAVLLRLNPALADARDRWGVRPRDEATKMQFKDMTALFDQAERQHADEPQQQQQQPTHHA